MRKVHSGNPHGFDINLPELVAVLVAVALIITVGGRPLRAARPATTLGG